MNCRLSSYLFFIATDIFAIQKISNISIKGLEFQALNMKLYAGHTCFLSFHVISRTGRPVLIHLVPREGKNMYLYNEYNAAGGLT